MNINQKAIELLEDNRYEESLQLFKEAVQHSRDVQSLTNLAWIYCYEEYSDLEALPLLEEVIYMKPLSYFPYNLLGEVYLRLEKWELAKDVLEKSISIRPTMTAYNNLGVSHYYLGNFQEAAKFFLLGSEPSDFALYSHVLCLIKTGAVTKARKILDTFSEQDSEFIGEVDLADLYVELGCFQDAITWFKKGWAHYYKQPSWINRYVYSLLKLQLKEKAQKLLFEVINEKVAELKDVKEECCDETWTEIDKQEMMDELADEIKVYEMMIQKILPGYIPEFVFTPSIKTACYLFGCKRHNYPEYK
ncbi:tetratricopeptide repeat protein [Bacillus sp. 31A1R]|uniref:Tetratricopeptide repeat protein n=1 Tax=Robertmurraya mangrovi TaxID=3098077 RepID=A0ABU5IWE8_9BACI|nr:tetratricopeptide repeat protein [Bacillus sp. 31A1R]MDZ5471436.1 tetratricopeptide repeat protein [Bacillus sp. 31A1R]